MRCPNCRIIMGLKTSVCPCCHHALTSKEQKKQRTIRRLILWIPISAIFLLLVILGLVFIPPDPYVDSLEIINREPEVIELEANEALTLSVGCYNFGYIDTVEQVNIYLDSYLIKTLDLHIDGNEHVTEYVKIEASELPEPGEYVLKTDHHNMFNDLRKTIRILEPSKYVFTFDDLDEPFAVNNIYTLKYFVENTGSSSGAKDYEISLNGQILASSNIDLKPGEYEFRTVKISCNLEGVFDLKINDTVVSQVTFY